MTSSYSPQNQESVNPDLPKGASFLEVKTKDDEIKELKNKSVKHD